MSGYPAQDMYTVVERSIQQSLLAAMVAAGLNFPIHNNQVDKKKYKDSTAAVSIMKVSDVPNFGTTGGAAAFLDTATMDGAGNLAQRTRAVWPDAYDLLYQIEVSADNLADVRMLEMVVRRGLRPRAQLFVWDSIAQAFTADWIEYHYAGYINRDNPENNLYNRILNVRFEAWDVFPAAYIPSMQQTSISLTASALDGSGQVVDTMANTTSKGEVHGFGQAFGKLFVS